MLKTEGWFAIAAVLAAGTATLIAYGHSAGWFGLAESAYQLPLRNPAKPRPTPSWNPAIPLF